MFRGVQFHPMVVATLVLQLFLFTPILLNTHPFANLSPKVWQLSALFTSLVTIGTILGYVSESLFHPIRFCRQHPVEILISAIFFMELCLPAGNLSL
jgi:hypothetical protein